jgi:histidine triad (HIT) family protein
MKRACIFGDIVKGQATARIIYQDKHVVAFLPRNQAVEGHLVVAPARHWATLFTIREHDAAQLMRAMKRLAGLLERKLGASGVNILHASGKDAQQSVMHLHFHLFPRFRNDGIHAWPPIPEWHGDLDAVAERLRGKRGGE